MRLKRFKLKVEPGLGHSQRRQERVNRRFEGFPRLLTLFAQLKSLGLKRCARDFSLLCQGVE
ncbi:MAG: hypothetical protein EBU55_10915, partial [Betaproteobacteria bacterium]|nr:hypothetical protein [Betaproteobacteria bacterium]